MSKHDTLINSLASELAPAPPLGNINRLALGWLVGSAIYTILVTHLLGPIRPNAFGQLISEPRFFAETLLGVLAIVAFGLAAFRGAIPGVLNRRLTYAASGMAALWLCSYLIGLAYPTLEPSMLGKRDHCVVQTFIFALPPMAIACHLVHNRYPLRPVQTALALSFAAGMLPALYMQFACMYAADHILKFHIGPGLAIIPVGIFLSLRYTRHRSQPR